MFTKENFISMTIKAKKYNKDALVIKLAWEVQNRILFLVPISRSKNV